MRSLKKLFIVPRSASCPSTQSDSSTVSLVSFLPSYSFTYCSRSSMLYIWPQPLRPRFNHFGLVPNTVLHQLLFEAGDECSLLDQPCEWYLKALRIWISKYSENSLWSFFPPRVFMRCLKKDDSDLTEVRIVFLQGHLCFSLLLLNLLTCSFYRQCMFLPDFWTTDMIKLV